ncbi:MAG: VCBS repeat-containing protein [Bacteroidetes bacterium]|nr:VCBS repeat-containing protein [Bacteroidota bacterium]
MKNRVFLFAILFSTCSVWVLQAQSVALNLQPNLLNPILGFPYNNCVVDMNNDFLDDVVRPTDNGLYIDYQQLNGSYQQSFFPVFFSNLPTWSVCAGDLNNDGYTDLLFGDGDAVSFVMALGNGVAYVEYPKPDWIFSQRSTMADIDNDGHLDAFVCHDVDQSLPFRNDGNGNLTMDQSLIVTADRPGNYAAIWTDYDNDGDIDLYITKCKGGAPPGDIDRTNLLYQNNGDGTFSEVGALAGLNDNAQSWSTVFEDFDNDGDFDAFIVNHDFQNRLFRNNGDGTFTDIIVGSGINPNDLGAWENASGDFNNDGFVDILSEMQNELYLNNGDWTFTGQNSPVSGGGIGDLNNDGFLDVLSNNNTWLNSGNNNNWLKINTIGAASNRSGIGARVEIYGPWGVQVREVRSGQSFSPMSSLTVHFGLGQATGVDLVVVKWPSGVVSTVGNPAINTTLNVPEAGCILPPTELALNGDTELCPGETLEITAPDGFDYQWSNGSTTQSLTVSDAGIYSVVLTDSTGCVSFSNSVAVSIIAEIPPVIFAESDIVFCEGGSVVLTVSEGQNPTWSNGQTGQSTTVATPGDYVVSTDALCGGGQVPSEPVSVLVLNADAPVVMGATIAAGDSVLLTADGPGLQWFDAAAGGNLLASGPTFQTPPLGAPVTYFVEAHHLYPGEIQSGGKPDNSGNGGLPTSGAYNLFDVWEPFTLVSVTVYVPNNAPTGQRTIQLFDGSGMMLNELVFFLNPGLHVLELNFPVPVGTNLSLRCQENNLFRNTSANVQYPYPIGTVGLMTNDALGNGYYYYFYNWQIQKTSYECVSERVPVLVGVTPADETFSAQSLEVFPNPASRVFFVKISGRATLLRLFDMTGREVLRKGVAGNETVELRADGLVAGFYQLQIEVNDRSLSQKIVIE